MLAAPRMSTPTPPGRPQVVPNGDVLALFCLLSSLIRLDFVVADFTLCSDLHARVPTIVAVEL